MNNTTQSIRVGLFFIVGVALIWIVYDALSIGGVGTQEGYPIEAGFSDIKQLKPSDEVRMAGVRIGNVLTTRLDGTQALIILSVANDVKIPVDSEATITTSGLLGTNYVSIRPGKATQDLAANAMIKSYETPGINEVIADVGNMSKRLDEIFDKVDETLGGFSSDKEGGLFANLNDLIVKNKDRISNTFANFDEISSKIASGQGTIGKLVNDDQAYDTLLATADDVANAAKGVENVTDDAKGIMDQIKTGQGVVGTLLYDKEAAAQVKDAIANVDDFSKKLNGKNSTLGRIMNDDSLYVQAEDTLSRVNGAVSGLDDNGAITAVGILATALF